MALGDSLCAPCALWRQKCSVWCSQKEGDSWRGRVFLLKVRSFGVAPLPRLAVVPQACKSSIVGSGVNGSGVKGLSSRRILCKCGEKRPDEVRRS